MLIINICQTYIDHWHFNLIILQHNTELIVKYFESQGFTTLKVIEDKEYFEDLCVVELLFGGPTRPCEWLEFDSQEKIVWLKGTDKGEMAVPDIYRDLTSD